MGFNMNLKSKAIGVFDSGLGGLTVVKELRKILPSAQVTLRTRALLTAVTTPAVCLAI